MQRPQIINLSVVRLLIQSLFLIICLIRNITVNAKLALKYFKNLYFRDFKEMKIKIFGLFDFFSTSPPLPFRTTSQQTVFRSKINENATLYL